MRRFVILSICLFFLLVTSPGVMAGVYYVDAAAAGLRNGTSWTNAYTTIQAGIDAASADGGGEVWVKNGVYTGTTPDIISDSFETLNRNAVDIVGEEKTTEYTAGGQRKTCHINFTYTTDSLTSSPPAATFGNTTEADTLAARLSALTNLNQDVLITVNHPSFIWSGLTEITDDELLQVVNLGACSAMELKEDHDVAKWDYVLANLDDQAGACTKMVWGVRSDDMHESTSVDYTECDFMMGCIPTEAQDPVYRNRRIAYKDMIRRGSIVAMSRKAKCGIPKYTLASTNDTAASFQVDVFVNSIPGATYAVLAFFGCDSSTGGSPGKQLYITPVTINAQNCVTYYLTRTGDSSGTPLTLQEKANIKYIRPMLMWRVGTDTLTAYLQPVRIKSNGAWWGGPAITLAGNQAVVGPSPYPSGGSDTGETVYFAPHSHSIASDGDASPATMRRRYWDNYGQIDPSKPRFSILTDHNMRTPFTMAVRSVVVLKENVSVYGGFSGYETSKEQRNLSSDSQTIIDGQNLTRCVQADGSRWKNKSAAVLDGFHITKGKVLNGSGGGMYVWDCSLTISNCKFSDNFADYGGGGLELSSSSSPQMNNCTITRNTTSYNTWGAGGGGILADSLSCPRISYCLFTDNISRRGGAICSSSSPVCSFTRFQDNTAVGLFWGGGAIYNFGRHAKPQLLNCVFVSNTSDANYASGGAIKNDYLSAPTITNSLFLSNAARGISSNGGAIYCYNASPILANNIIAYNSSGIASEENGTPLLRNNCVYANGTQNYFGVSPGQGDISQDPLLTDVSSGDYHLLDGSPCIDSGWNEAPDLPSTDMDGDLRIGGGCVDIGVDEYWWNITYKGPSIKRVADGRSVEIKDAIVTAFLPPCRIYVETAARTFGILVYWPYNNITQGMKVDVTGLMKTCSGERFIDASDITPVGTGNVKPLGLSNLDLGGSDWYYNPLNGVGQRGVANSRGINNIGLLVQVWGKVTYVGSGFFYIDDGRHVSDIPGYTGIKIDSQSITPPSVNDWVGVTGISSIEPGFNTYTRILRVRSASDIVKFRR